MKKTIFLYALILALAAFALEWFEYRYITRAYSTEIYIIVLVVAFGVLGVWVGTRLTSRPVGPEFSRNDAALKSLGITEREYGVLELMASGQANKEIARSLEISPNTVKTHAANLFSKLEVTGRVDAINKGRDLRLIP
jgi:DNA-binding CsgD family transcriptional regulator